MFIDKRDQLRNEKIGRKPIEAMLKSSAKRVAVPMPALGEAIHKVREKAKDRSREVFEELNRLLDNGIIEVRFVRNANATFHIAQELSKDTMDDRDSISPMDALIAASAATDPQCKLFIPNDSRLLLDGNVSEILNNWRSENRLTGLQINDDSKIIKQN